jgi:signal transduction histidine kinase/CheY-like chemotaxis protein
VVYGAMAAFGSYLPAFYAFLFPALVPVTVWALLQGDIEHVAFGAMSLLWLPVVAVMSFNHSRAIEESLRLRYENFDLLEDLKRQKELAEQANIAKSRFLASASHDLRQPVHALGMFVGALRAAEISEPAQRLLRHVEGSVSALDTLFTSLLDISRLDADVVRPAPAAFAIQPLLDRIARDHEVEAAEKGLRIAVVASTRVVRSDPVLLERIVRNIVSNAVRYTDEGRILIGCRRRGGDLDIEIWDTGAGISADAQEDIFQEFYQVGNPGRDRGQGLGLGLAIVRRLTNLLGHRLSLGSAPGKGSVFRIGAPLAKPEDVALDEEDETALGDLAHGLILVVDDETAIQEAMKSLLESWGHTVITAGSGEEMLAKVVDCTQRPDLIISDYRLRDDNGIAVIEQLQSEFNHAIPAMLLTGDTAPDRLAEARESGFVLLHKPLSEARLRAAMAAMAAG